MPDSIFTSACADSDDTESENDLGLRRRQDDDLDKLLELEQGFASKARAKCWRGQVGAIGGCALVMGCRTIGVPQLCALGGGLTLLVPVLMQ